MSDSLTPSPHHYSVNTPRTKDVRISFSYASHCPFVSSPNRRRLLAIASLFGSRVRRIVCDARHSLAVESVSSNTIKQEVRNVSDLDAGWIVAVHVVYRYLGDQHSG